MIFDKAAPIFDKHDHFGADNSDYVKPNWRTCVRSTKSGPDVFNPTLDVTKNRYAVDGTLVLQGRGNQTTHLMQDWGTPLSRVLSAITVTACSGICVPTVQTERAIYGVERLFTETTSASTRRWLHTDRLGSVVAATDNSATLVGSQLYDPWGQPETYDASGNPTGTMISRFGYTGELVDAPNAMLYLRARWYAPETGTFFGRDPFDGYPNKPYSLHYYQYGYSNPISNTDPSGRCDHAVDVNCIVEDQLKAEFNIKIAYPESSARRVQDPFLQCLSYDAQPVVCAYSAVHYWYDEQLGDLRPVLLNTLRDMDRKLNNNVSSSFRSMYLPKFYRVAGDVYGEWDPAINTIIFI